MPEILTSEKRMRYLRPLDPKRGCQHEGLHKQEWCGQPITHLWMVRANNVKGEHVLPVCDEHNQLCQERSHA